MDALDQQIALAQEKYGPKPKLRSLIKGTGVRAPLTNSIEAIL